MGGTDGIILILSIFFLIRGASRGIVKSFIGPFSIIVTTILSIIYYQITEDIVASLLIGLIGPLLLGLLLKFLFRIWVKATNTDIKKPRFLSRLGGAILTFIWGWVFIIFTLILLTVLPPWGKTLIAVHNDVCTSDSYIYIVRPLGQHFFAASKQNTTAVTSEGPSPEAKSLAQDPRFQKILQDPDIQKEINAHDIAKLMSNPKMMDFIRQIMSDPVAMKKIFTLYNSQPQGQATKNPPAPAPKGYYSLADTEFMENAVQ